MFNPRVFSRRRFIIAKIAVQICHGEWLPIPEYDALVAAEWERMIAHDDSSIWDGAYYRVLNLAQLEEGEARETLRLGTIRYRYIATFSALRDHHATHRLDPLNHLSTISLLQTNDGFYVFRLRVRNGSKDLIGGGVQPDELAISSGVDIERNLYKEIREEVGIAKCDIRDLVGIGIVYSSISNVLLIGHATTNLSTSEVQDCFGRRTDQEMAAAVFIPGDQLRSFLESMSDYRTLIPRLL
jgi:hypothetical protein